VSTAKHKEGFNYDENDYTENLQSYVFTRGQRKNREVIKYLEDLYDVTFQYLFEIEKDGKSEKISCCEISTFIAFLRALEKNDFKIIPYEWQE